MGYEKCHVLEFSTKKSTRVAKSSFAAELVAGNRCAEVLYRLGQWLVEMEVGAESVRDLLDVRPHFPLQLVTDAMDVFTTVQCPKPYVGTDQSVTLYVEALKEDLRGRITELAWVPTRWMLADAMTKNMNDELLGKLMATGSWRPDEWELYSQEDEYYCDVEARCSYLHCACLTTEVAPCWWHLPLIPDEEDLELTQDHSQPAIRFLRKPYGLADAPRVWTSTFSALQPRLARRAGVGLA